MPEGKILVIDDDPVVRSVLADILLDGRYQVETAGSGREGLDRMVGWDVDVALVDIMLPEQDGMEVLKDLLELDADLKVLIITGYPSLETASQAVRLGAFDYIVKPLENERVLLSVQNALQARRLALHNRQLLRDLQRANVVLGAINGLFQETLRCESKEEVARTCLELAKELTGSDIGFIGEIGQSGRLDVIAISDTGCADSGITKSIGIEIIRDTKVRGIWSQLVNDEASVVINKPDSQINQMRMPPGHPQIKSLLGVPLLHGNRALGVIALANKALGYEPADQEAIEALSVAFVEALNRKQAEEALRENEERLRNLFETMAEGVTLTTPEGRIIQANPAAERILELKRSELEEQSYFVHEWETLRLEGELMPPEEMAGFRAIKERQPVKDVAMGIRRSDGTISWINVGATPVINEEGDLEGVVSTFADITERVEAEAQIKASLREKEVLLKEVHHRVKNNLQIISSLLYLQARNVEDERPMEVLRDSQSRIRSMALVHERLYESPDLARVDFAEYVRTLASHLIRSYGVNTRAIQLLVNVDDVSLGVDTAIPCGLIINELVSNALKHAFPESREGTLSIELGGGNGLFTLTIRDDGVGFPKDVDFRDTGSLGLRLVNMLVDQLEGNIELDRNKGTEFKITFSEQG